MLDIFTFVVLSCLIATATAGTGGYQLLDDMLPGPGYLMNATITNGTFSNFSATCNMVFYDPTEDVDITLNSSCDTKNQTIIFHHNEYNTTINIDCEKLPDYKQLLLLGQISLKNCSRAVYSEKLLLSTENPPIFDGDKFRTDILLLAANHSTDNFTLAPRFCEINVTTEIVLWTARDESQKFKEIGLHCTKDMLPCFEKRELFKYNDIYCAGQVSSLVFNANVNTVKGARTMTENEFRSFSGLPPLSTTTVTTTTMSTTPTTTSTTTTPTTTSTTPTTTTTTTPTTTTTTATTTTTTPTTTATTPTTTTTTPTTPTTTTTTPTTTSTPTTTTTSTTTTPTTTSTTTTSLPTTEPQTTMNAFLNVTDSAADSTSSEHAGENHTLLYVILVIAAIVVIAVIVGWVFKSRQDRRYLPARQDEVELPLDNIYIG